MTTKPIESAVKPTKYYIDFENVHGAGLKGVDVLDEQDEVVIIYSQAAETFHIEHAIDILKSKARISFVEADAGTRNAADFQLIVALYANMDDAFDYAIISGDGGFDAAIKMGERMGKPAVRRLANIAGDEAEPEKPKSRRSRRSRSNRDAAKEVVASESGAGEVAGTQTESAPEAAEDNAAKQPSREAAQDTKAAEAPAIEQEEQKPSSSKRRPRRRKRNGAAPEEQPARDGSPQGDETLESADQPGSSPETQPEDNVAAPASNMPSDDASEKRTPRLQATKRVSTRKETDEAYAKAAEAMRLASQVAPSPEPEKEESVAAAVASEENPGESTPDTVALVKSFLEQAGVQLTESQLATVASALEGPDGRQGFYRRIIKIERQQNGRILYRQVREHYTALLKAIAEDH